MQGLSCYRYILLGRECDLLPSSAGSPCSSCLSSPQDAKEYLPCQPQEALTNGFDSAFETAIQLDISQWVLREQTSDLLFTIDYSSFSAAIHNTNIFNDLTYFQSNNVKPEKARTNFLRQFSAFHNRWGGSYDYTTGETLNHASEYQIGMLGEDEEELTDEERCTILTALRCLIMLHNLEEPGDYIPWGRKLDSFDWPNEVTVSDAELRSHFMETGWCAHPEVRVLDVTDYVWTEQQERLSTAQPPVEQPSSDPYPERYMTMVPEENTVIAPKDALRILLPKTLSLTRSLILRNRAKDWPTVFFALFIIHMTADDMGRCSDFSDALNRIKKPTKEALRTLCALYLHVCPPQYRPLSEAFDEEAYARLLGVAKDNVRVECYSRHQRLWRQEKGPSNIADEELTQSGESQLGRFMDILDQYTYGFSL